MYNYERSFLVYKAHISIKVAFSLRRIFKRQFLKDYVTSESAEFLKDDFE